MNKKMNYSELFLLVGFLLYIVSRIFFLIVYNFKYTDEDQLVMWAGTVLSAHGHLQEPMWMGQNYGSMLESFLALPLYLLKVPLNIALPISSFIIGLIPFVVILISCIRENKYIQGYGILGLLLLFSIDMDVLMSVPRSFIPGYCLTVPGLMLCMKSSKKSLQVFAGFLTTLGVVMSETAICIVLPVLVYMFFQWNTERDFATLKEKLWCLVGVALGVIARSLCLGFYDLHPEYLVWHKPNLRFDLHLFLSRIEEFTIYFKNLILFENAWVFLFLVLALIVFFCATKNYGEALIAFTTIGGLCLCLGFAKVHVHDCVLWSASRQFLFVPYNLALAIYLSDVTLKSNHLKALIKGRSLCVILLILAIGCSWLIKYMDYHHRVDEFKESELNAIISVEALKNICQEEYHMMKQYNCDFVVVPHTVHSLGLVALYDEDVVAWGKGGIDRNNYLFMKERYKIREQFLEITYQEGQLQGTIKYTGNRSVIQYLYDEYGITRSPLYEAWDGKRKLE